MFGSDKSEISDLELLESQKSYKIPFIYYFLKNKWWQYLLKFAVAYLFSLFLDKIESMRDYSFWTAFVMLELVLYNVFSHEEYKP